MYFILFLIVFVFLFRLQSRVNKLEKSISPMTSASTYQPTSQNSLAEPIAIPASTTAQEEQSLPEEILFSKFTTWLKEDWLLKLGALLLIIGFGWLTSYAFIHDWIGPVGRITLGICAGALFILLGWWRIKDYIHQGGIFMVLGSTTILLTIFAAREIYDFFTPLSALAIMFLSTSLLGIASVKFKSPALALANLILAGIAPLFTNPPTTDYIGLFSYLIVVILGSIWIVALTGNRSLTTGALVLVVLYSMPYLSTSVSTDIGTILIFAYAFVTLFFLTNTISILKAGDEDIYPDLVTATGNGLFLLAWIMTAVQKDWQSLVISAWMIVFTVGAFLIFKATKRSAPFYVYAGIGVVMLVAATSAELEGATLTIAFTLEMAMIALISYLFLGDIKIAERAGLLFMLPIILSLESIISSAWEKGVLHEDFFVLLTLGFTLLGLGTFFMRPAEECPEDGPKQNNMTLLVIGSLYIYILLWLSLHALLQDDNTAVMISLVIYTLVGLVTYFLGLMNGMKNLQLYGGVIIGAVVARLFLVDVWKMELVGRIATFFLVGTLLMSTAFIGKKEKNDLPSNT